MSESEPLPRDYQSLRTWILERAASLPKRLNQVAAYALEHPDDIAFGTAASIASAANVQASTLVRFSQTMGYQGFSELQDVFRSRLRERILSYDERMAQLREHAHDAPQPIVLFQGFADAARKSISDLWEKIDATRMDETIELLARADTIYLIGLRRSFPIAAYMSYAFGKLGVRHRFVDGLAGLGREQLASARATDAVLAISFAPYASETLDLAERARASQIPLAAITDNPFSPLVRSASVWLEVAESNFEGFRSMAATLTLAMTLTVAIAERRATAHDPAHAEATPDGKPRSTA